MFWYFTPSRNFLSNLQMHLIHTSHWKCNLKLKHGFRCISVTFWGNLKNIWLHYNKWKFILRLIPGMSAKLMKIDFKNTDSRNECETLIPVATTSHGLKPEQVCWFDLVWYYHTLIVWYSDGMMEWYYDIMMVWCM